MTTAASQFPLVQPTRARWSDFYELTKPRMNLLVVSTTLAGYYMAAKGSGAWQHVAPTLIGTALCAAGASVLNQFSERELDALMPRTRKRPLPAQRLDPAEAVGFGVGMAVGGVSVLTFMVNPLTALLAAFTLLSYVLIYTPLKKRSSLNTIVGAVPGAIPPVMGWTAVHGTIGWPAVAMFGILFLWQIPHFLAIAIMYRNDYAAAGFKMLPVIDQPLTMTSRQIVLFALALLPVSMLPFWLGMCGGGYLIAAAIGGLVFLFAGIACAWERTRRRARQLFFASIIYLPALMAAMIICRR